jgi:cytochrome c553
MAGYYLQVGAMRNLSAVAIRVSAFALAVVLPCNFCGAAERPDWAFFVPAAGVSGSPRTQGRDDGNPRTVHGSARTYTLAQIQDVLNPPDWYPDEHPLMPERVAHGRRGMAGSAIPVLPCALCHLPNGAGHVESASLAGLPAAYMVRQFNDIRDGNRHICVGDEKSESLLTGMKDSYTDSEILAAAKYFSLLRPRRWIRVVEASQGPRLCERRL